LKKLGLIWACSSQLWFHRSELFLLRDVFWTAIIRGFHCTIHSLQIT